MSPQATDSLSKTLTAKNRVHTVVPETARAAREQVGLSLEEASRRSKLKHIAELEAGQWHPTRPQLQRLAKLYMVHTWVLQEPELPEVAQFDLQVPEFRKFEDIEPDFGYETRNLLARLEAMRTDVMWLSEDIEQGVQEFSPPVELPPNGLIDDSDLRAAAERVIGWLKIDEMSVTFEQRRQAVEDSGVHIFVTSPFSHWSKIDRRKFRGFAVPKDVLPLLVVNGSDAPGDRSFTLFHELAHLLTKRVSYDNKPIVDHGDQNEALEVMCDRFAAYVLWRGSRLDDLMAMCGGVDVEEALVSDEMIASMTRRWELSAWSAAVMLHLSGQLDEHQFAKLNRQFGRRADQPKPKSSGGGARNRRREVRRQFGGRYFETVMQAYHARKITLVSACLMTELKVHQILGPAH